MAKSWSDSENRATVSAYLDMLETLMRGGDVVKSHVNRELRNGPVRDRTHGSVEFKMQNVSSALADRGFPWVDGYKPADNYQQSLANTAAELANETKLLAKCTRWSYESFAEALAESGLAFTHGFVRAFITSLATKRFTILTGLSGSGKTQITLQFGHWLGEDHYTIIPVRPDWTGAEALFGYEDALLPDDEGRRAWHVPPALRFMLRAARDEYAPYLLVLDEMNLAHVERYFADVLSGMESGEACLPNLVAEEDGHWRIPADADHFLPFPDNLFIVGTVNVDETTYMFSPKVLDRANTLEFRVATDDLQASFSKPTACASAPPELSRGFLEVSRNYEWAESNPHPSQDEFVRHLKTVHRLLSESGFEFGHRVFYEALRFAALLHSAGSDDVREALDLQILQKVLPRLHGSRRRLEPTLVALARFCHALEFEEGTVARSEVHAFDPLERHDQAPALPRSFDKLRRMTQTLRANQFVSFTE